MFGLRSLQTLIFAPVVVLLFVTAIGTYLLISNSVEDFANRSIQEQLTSLAATIVEEADDEVDQCQFRGVDCLQGGLAKVHQIEVFAKYENIARQNSLGLMIWDEAGERVAFARGIPDADIKPLADRIGRADIESGTVLTNVGGATLYTHISSFEPWAWQVLLLRESSAFAALKTDVRRFYLATGAIVLILAGAMSIYLRHVIAAPISKMVSAIRTQAAPDYQGIREFEYLGKSIKESLALRRDLELAHELQLAMLPADLPAPSPSRPLEFAAVMAPARTTCGDFYDLIEFGAHRIGFIIADVSGKGAGAALFMARAHTVFATCAKDGSDPHIVLDRMNESLCEQKERQMFATVLYGHFDGRTKQVSIACAGHHLPLVISGGQTRELNAAVGPPVGLIPNASYEACNLQMAAGDTLFCYTDGIVDAPNCEGERFGNSRLVAVLGEGPNTSARSMTSDVVKALSEFVESADQFDDITCLAMTCLRPDQAASQELSLK